MWRGTSDLRGLSPCENYTFCRAFGGTVTTCFLQAVYIITGTRTLISLCEALTNLATRKHNRVLSDIFECKKMFFINSSLYVHACNTC